MCLKCMFQMFHRGGGCRWGRRRHVSGLVPGVAAVVRELDEIPAPENQAMLGVEEVHHVPGRGVLQDDFPVAATILGADDFAKPPVRRVPQRNPGTVCVQSRKGCGPMLVGICWECDDLPMVAAVGASGDERLHRGASGRQKPEPVQVCPKGLFVNDPQHLDPIEEDVGEQGETLLFPLGMEGLKG